MGHFYNPPGLFVGGRQPYDNKDVNPQIEAVPVNNPPFLNEGRFPSPTALSVVLTAWQPDLWPYVFMGRAQPYEPKKESAGLLAVAANNPPFGHLGRDIWVIGETVALNQPTDWPHVFIGRQGRLQPYGPAKLNPSITAVRVDSPPFGHLGRDPWVISETVALAQPTDWPYVHLAADGRSQPYAPPPLAPGIPGQSVDAPPFISEELDQALSQIAQSWRPPDPNPTLPGKLSPGIPGQSIDNPPFPGGDELLPTNTTVLAAWAPYQFPTLPRYLPQGAASVSSQPYAPAWLATVLFSWQPLDPQPTLPRRLNPSITAVQVDDPPFGPLWMSADPWTAAQPLPTLPGKLSQPFVAAVAFVPGSRPWLNAVLGAWQPPDPGPMLPRNLSPGIPGQSVDLPPFPGADEFGAAVASLLAASQPDPWSYSFQGGNQPYAPRRLVAGVPGVSVDPPPRFRPFVPVAQIPDPMPVLPRWLNPSITAVPVDNPPFTHRERIVITATIVAANQPPDPQPFLGGFGPLLPRNYATGVAVRVDNPPFTHWGRVVVAAEIVAQTQPPNPNPFMGGRQPLDAARLPPQITAVRVDNPPFGLLRLPADPSLRPIDVPFPTLTVKLPQGAVVSAQLAFGRFWLPSLLAQWQPPDPLPTLPRNLNPSVTAVRVDDPPFGPLWMTVDPWAPGQPPQAIRTKLAQAFVQVAYVPLSRAWQSTVLRAWIAPDLTPTLPRNLNPSYTAVAVNNPPFTHRGRTQTQLQSIATITQPDPWTYTFTGRTQPYDYRKMSPGIPGMSVDAPPLGIISALVPITLPYKLPILKTKLPPSALAVRVDNPPFGPLWMTADVWFPPPPAPILPKARFTSPLRVRIIAQPPLSGGKVQPTLKGADAAPTPAASSIKPSLKGADFGIDMSGTDAAPGIKGKVDS